MLEFLESENKVNMLTQKLEQLEKKEKELQGQIEEKEVELETARENWLALYKEIFNNPTVRANDCYSQMSVFAGIGWFLVSLIVFFFNK